MVLPSDSSDAHALHLANFETGDLPPDFPGTVISVSKTLGDKLKVAGRTPLASGGAPLPPTHPSPPPPICASLSAHPRA